MKSNNLRTRVFWIAGTVLSLIISFLLCRYAFFGFHGNTQWSIFMLVIGLVVTGVAAIFDGRKMMVCTVAGYIGGFALGLIFGTDSVDQGGGALNNWWAIWTISFFAIAVIGVIWEITVRIQKKRTLKRNNTH